MSRIHRETRDQSSLKRLL